MPIVSQRIAQADDPIYKSGLTISLHSTSSQSTRDILKSRTNKRQQTHEQQQLQKDDSEIFIEKNKYDEESK